MSDVITHLWSSTLVLLAALIAARLLPLTARTRYVLLLCGLLKFAVPSIAILGPLRAIGIDLHNLGPQSAGTISIEWLGGPTTLRTLSPQPDSHWQQILTMAWIVSAVAIALQWAAARRRLVSSALKTASAASRRERAALAAARRRLGLRASVDVMRSTICEAPAVVRIIRPLVVLPDGGCDALDDSELESLLRHECAHVARRDNLAGLIESAIVAAFWFHPLVWIAQRAIATAREQACDETAATTAEAIDRYVSALSKICSAVLAPRLAGVSCMASSHLKERLDHIMEYEALRNRALSHRLVVALVAFLLIAVTAGSGLRAASSSDTKQTPYLLKFAVRPGDLPDRLEFTGRVFETESGLLVAKPGVSFKRGSGATIHIVVDDRDFYVDIRDTGGTVTVSLRALQNGVQQQQSTYLSEPKAAAPKSPNSASGRYTGEPISINLKDAEIKDVLQKFAKLMNSDIQYPPTLEAKVTLNVKDMPWDEAFELILRQANLTYERQGDAIIIKQ